AEAPALADEPAPTPVQAERVTPVPASQQQSQSRPISPPSPPKPATKAGGASRIGSDSLGGAGGGPRDADAPMPASRVGSAVKASLVLALARQPKPYWSSPQGVDVDLLVTVLPFDLNEDGSLDGRPRVVSQSGITDANRPQA